LQVEVLMFIYFSLISSWKWLLNTLWHSYSCCFSWILWWSGCYPHLGLIYLLLIVITCVFLCYVVHTEAIFRSRILSSAASTVNRRTSSGGFGLLPSAESSPVSFHAKISGRESCREHISGLHVTFSSRCLWLGCFSLSTSASWQQRLATSKVIVGMNWEDCKRVFCVLAKTASLRCCRWTAWYHVLNKGGHLERWTCDCQTELTTLVPVDVCSFWQGFIVK